jgi:hypothetical protein
MIRQKVSQADLAAMAGVARENVSRVLHEWTMVQQKLGPAYKRMAVEEGIAGGAPGMLATSFAIA